MQTVLTIFLAGLTLLVVSLRRTYSRVPLRELKRRARHGDEISAAILKVVGYGYSLNVVLWFFVGISSAAFFVNVSATAPVWFALTASGLLVWVGFVIIPASRVSFLGTRLAAWSAPALTKLLPILHPPLDWIARFVHRHRPVNVHTGLYDRRDLIDLLELQLVQPENRIEKAELELAFHALTFGDHKVSEHMIPRRVVKSVAVDTPIGPIIMDELHGSSHSRFPVYEGKQDNLVGTLFLRDLLQSKHSGTVRSIMKPKVSYVHEDQSLNDALQAVLKTHQHMFVVVNSFEEYVGIITMEDILEAVIGSPIIDEFDQYEDLRAVAVRAAKTEHKEHTEQTTPVESEVIE